MSLNCNLDHLIYYPKQYSLISPFCSRDWYNIQKDYALFFMDTDFSSRVSYIPFSSEDFNNTTKLFHFQNKSLVYYLVASKHILTFNSPNSIILSRIHGIGGFYFAHQTTVEENKNKGDLIKQKLPGIENYTILLKRQVNYAKDEIFNERTQTNFNNNNLSNLVQVPLELDYCQYETMSNETFSFSFIRTLRDSTNSNEHRRYYNNAILPPVIKLFPFNFDNNGNSVIDYNLFLYNSNLNSLKLEFKIDFSDSTSFIPETNEPLYVFVKAHYKEKDSTLSKGRIRRLLYYSFITNNDLQTLSFNNIKIIDHIIENNKIIYFILTNLDISFGRYYPSTDYNDKYEIIVKDIKLFLSNLNDNDDRITNFNTEINKIHEEEDEFGNPIPNINLYKPIYGSWYKIDNLLESESLPHKAKIFLDNNFIDKNLKVIKIDDENIKITKGYFSMLGSFIDFKNDTTINITSFSNNLIPDVNLNENVKYIACVMYDSSQSDPKNRFRIVFYNYDYLYDTETFLGEAPYVFANKVFCKFLQLGVVTLKKINNDFYFDEILEEYQLYKRKYFIHPTFSYIRDNNIYDESNPEKTLIDINGGKVIEHPNNPESILWVP